MSAHLSPRPRAARVAVALATGLAGLALAASAFAAEPQAPAKEECSVGGVSGTASAESLAAVGAGASHEQVNAVAGRMICLCGCGNMVLSDCECSEATKDKSRIRALLAAGKPPEAVVAAFVAADGEQRLAAPTKKGFNLVVWIAPFAALVLGGTFLGWLLRSWTRRRPAAPARAERPVAPEDPAYRARLEEELRRGA